MAEEVHDPKVEGVINGVSPYMITQPPITWQLLRERIAKPRIRLTLLLEPFAGPTGTKTKSKGEYI